MNSVKYSRHTHIFHTVRYGPGWIISIFLSDRKYGQHLKALKCITAINQVHPPPPPAVVILSFPLVSFTPPHPSLLSLYPQVSPTFHLTSFFSSVTPSFHSSSPPLSSLLGLTLTDEATVHWSSLIKWIFGHLALCGLLWDPLCSLHYREAEGHGYCCYSAAMQINPLQSAF